MHRHKISKLEEKKLRKILHQVEQSWYTYCIMFGLQSTYFDYEWAKRVFEYPPIVNQRRNLKKIQLFF